MPRIWYNIKHNDNRLFINGPNTPMQERNLHKKSKIKEYGTKWDKGRTILASFSCLKDLQA